MNCELRSSKNVREHAKEREEAVNKIIKVMMMCETVTVLCWTHKPFLVSL